MERIALRGIHGGWKEEETELLWREVDRALSEGQPLKQVFDEVASHTGRKSNSIRNYYYAQRKEREDEMPSSRAMPFVPFCDEEVRELMRTVLAAKAEGQSVRACVQRMGGGDRALMLRFQNKYRSVLKTRPELVKEIVAELREEGIACPDILKESPRREPLEELVRDMCEETARLGNPQVGQLFESLRALLKAANGRVQSRRRLEEYDRMVVRNDMLRIQLDDTLKRQERLDETLDAHLAICREHLGLPQAQRELHALQFETALIESLGNLESTITEITNEQAEDEDIIQALTLSFSGEQGEHRENEACDAPEMGKVLIHPGQNNA